MKKILAASLIFSSLIMVGCDSGMKKPDEPTVSREANLQAFLSVWLMSKWILFLN